MNFRNVRGVAVAIMATVALGAVSVGSAHAEGRVLTIAVVDVPLVLQDSKAGKVIQKALENQRESYTRDMSGREDKLRQANQELDRQRGALSQEAYNQKRRDFEQSFADFQRDVQARRKAIEQGFNEAMQTLHSSVLEVIAGLVQERGITMVLAKQQVVIVENSLDMTREVLERVDKKTPSVAVKFPSVKK